jgi:predicted nucleic acid-binding protein
MEADPVFIDTNGWIALLIASDALHAAADRHFAQAGFNCLLAPP